MTIDDIGICKALTLENNIIIGKLFKLGDRCYLYGSSFKLNDAGNLSGSNLIMTQVKDDSICAYTYMKDIFEKEVFAYDVLKIPDTEKYIYVYWDNIKNMWLYITSWDSINEESLNINELELTNYNLLLNKDMQILFNQEDLQ